MPTPPKNLPPLRTTSVPNFVQIHPAVWISLENRQTDKHIHHLCPLCIRCTHKVNQTRLTGLDQIVCPVRVGQGRCDVARGTFGLSHVCYYKSGALKVFIRLFVIPVTAFVDSILQIRGTDLSTLKLQWKTLLCSDKTFLLVQASDVMMHNS